MYVCEYIQRGKEDRQAGRQTEGQMWVLKSTGASYVHQVPSFLLACTNGFFDGPELTHYSLCLIQFVVGVST